MVEKNPTKEASKKNEFVQTKIRFSIRTKLLLLIFTILISSLGAVAWFGLNKFIADKESYISETVSYVSSITSSQINQTLNNIRFKLSSFSNAIEYNFKKTKDRKAALQGLLSGIQRDFIYVAVYPIGGRSQPKFYYNSRALARLKTSPQRVKKHFPLKALLSNTRKQSLYLSNATTSINYPLIRLSFRHKTISNKSVLVSAVFKQDLLISTEKRSYTAFLLDSSGKVLAHPDAAMVHSRIDYSALSAYEDLKSLPTGSTKVFTDLENIEMFAGLAPIAGTQTRLIAQIPKSDAFRSTKEIIPKMLFIILSVAIVTLFIGIFFAGSLSKPLLRLAEAAKKVAAGNFNLKIPVKSRDEIGALASTFNFMTEGLKERDRVKQTFSRYVSKQVVEKILSVEDELQLTGENREVSVMFTDIRGFTSMSEKLAPNEVVDILNQYFRSMVDVVFKHGGSLDKYIGDAMMVLFGAPLPLDQKELRSVSCALELQSELSKLNQRFAQNNKPTLNMGIGINTGVVIAGNIGSEARLEYTVIGDNVNTAQRIEAATKPYNGGTLISESTYRIVSDHFKFQKMDPIMAKGKSEALQLYMLIGEKVSTVAQTTPPATSSQPPAR